MVTAEKIMAVAGIFVFGMIAGAALWDKVKR
jgi:hypothetical protein